MLRVHVIRTLMGFAMGYLLYRSVPLSIPVAILFLAYSIIGKDTTVKKKKRMMSGKLREFLICLEPHLGTSGTFPKAFEGAVKDYERMYGKDELYGSLSVCNTGFSLNESTGEVLVSMARRIDIEDAYLFAESIDICEDTGGNLMEITKHTIGMISEKIRLEKDIETVLASCRLEQLLISVIPAAILVLLSVGADSYLSPLYVTTGGRIAMTAAGFIFCISWIAGNKITRIEV